MDQMDQRLSVWGFAAPITESNDLLREADTEPFEPIVYEPVEHYQDSVLRNTSEASGRQTADDCEQPNLSWQADDTSRGTHSRDEVDDWFNLSAFETEPSQDVDADEVQAPGNNKETSLSRRRSRQASNREHQRRWRIRQKERSQSVQKQLCIAATELEELKRRQLEVKGYTYAGAQACNPAVEPELHVDGSPAVTEAAPAGEPFVPPDCFDACNMPVLTISVSGRKLPASSREISEMPVNEFVALWAAYNVELRKCLVSLSCVPDAHVESSMQQLTLEALRLVACCLAMNPAVHQAFMTGQHQAYRSGQNNLGQVVQHQLGQTFYTSLLIVLALSDEQIQDLMLVRLLYHSKRTWLRQERRQLLSRMHDVEDQSSNPCQHV